MTDASPTAPAPWSLWQRILFRYLCLHWLLYAFSDPQGNPLISLLGVVRFFCDKLAEWGQALVDLDPDLKLSEWTKKPLEWIGDAQGERLNVVDGTPTPPHGWWKELTTWLSDASARLSSEGKPLFEVFHQRTGSGDTMHDWVKLGCIAVAAALLTLVWSLLDRRKSYPRLGRWLHLGARWYLALQLLGYGMAKFYGFTQFPVPGISGLTREVGDHSPMGLVWTFLGASEPYKYLGGAGEVLGFALILHRRTVLLGAFVTVGVMGNVCAFNWLYGVPVKLYSTHLLLIAVLLMAPYRHRLWALFVSNSTSDPVDLRVVHSRWLGWPLLALGCLWAIGLVWQGHESRTAMYETERFAQMLKQPQLFGYWKVEKMLRDGEEVALSDASRWKYLAIDRGEMAWVETQTGQRHYWNVAEDLDQNEVTFRPRGPAQASEAGETWAIERSTVTRRVRHPTPTTSFGEMTDGERQAIVWRGTWDGQEIELHTVQKVFRLHDAFRLVREFPR